MKYSVIDISSSSLSLIIAQTEADKTEIIFKDRVSLSLLHYLEAKKLSERGIEKLIETLHTMKDECSGFGVRYCYLISTAAMRYIENCDEVSKIVTERTGLPVNFLDGNTEAFCDYVANLYYASYEWPVLIDLGGKSLEICDLSKNDKKDMLCLDFGLLDLHRKFIKKIQPSEREAKEIKKYVTDKFDKADLPKKETYATAVMVGATNRAIYDIYAEYTDAKSEDGVKTIRYKKFKKLVEYLLSDADRSALILKYAPEKLYLIGPAAIVLKALFKRFDLDNIVVSDRGVKEGYLELILAGKEKGAYFDFETGQQGGERHDSKPRRPKSKPKENKNSEKKSDDTEKKAVKKQAAKD